MIASIVIMRPTVVLFVGFPGFSVFLGMWAERYARNFADVDSKTIMFMQKECIERIEACVNGLRLESSRKIDMIVLHCSATPQGRDVTVDDVRRWHLQRGFADVGYHFVIRLDGTVETGRAIDKVGAHCKGHNRNSIGICYVGGADDKLRSKDTRTLEQMHTLDLLLRRLREVYPKAVVRKHRELAATDCPGF